MSTAPIGNRQSPIRPQTVELQRIAPILPRLRCSTCRARLWIDQPTPDEAGRLFCAKCSREYAEVVDRLPPRIDREAWATLTKVVNQHGQPPALTKTDACPPSGCVRRGPQGGLCRVCTVRQHRERRKAVAS